MTKKVVAFMGSYRKSSTLKIVERFERELRALGEVEFKYFWLKDLHMKPCRGCGLCISKGEEFCPLKDDRDQIYAGLMEADGVILATPVYSLQVTALMKNMLDRLAFIFHRPRCFGKTFIPIVTQGVYGMEKVVLYLDEVARLWGFKTCTGVALTIPWDKLLPEEEEQIDGAVKRGAADFFMQLHNPVLPVPSLKEVMMFHGVRSFHMANIGLPADHDYYMQQGWFTSDYFYPVKISWYKKLIGSWVGRKSRQQAQKIQQARDLLP